MTELSAFKCTDLDMALIFYRRVEYEFTMLQPFMHMLLEKRIVLASTSPRRKQILENIVIIMFHSLVIVFVNLNVKFNAMSYVCVIISSVVLSFAF